MSFGNIIKKLRSDRNMTQEQLAEVLSISAQAVSRWETNIALPDISLLPILANFFDVTTDFLLEVDASAREKEIESLSHGLRNTAALPPLVTVRSRKRAYNQWSVVERR